MARRRRGSILDLIQGFEAGYGLVNKVLSDGEMRQIAEAKQENSPGFTDSQAADLNAAAASGQYDIVPDDKGGYAVTAKAGGKTGNIAPTATRTQFIGKTYDAPLSQVQEDKARLMAMSGVMGKFGDPMKAMQLRQQASQADQMERQGKLTDMQIARETRLDDQQKNLDAANSEVAEWMKGRQKLDANGQPLPMTDDDFIAAGKKRVFALADRGLFDHAQAAGKEAMDYATKKLQAETAERTAAVRDAVARAANGDYTQALAAYNKYIPDGSQATGVKTNKDGSFDVERVSAIDGSKLPPMKYKNLDQMLSTLQSLADPTAATNYLERTFKHDIESRRLGLEGARVGLEGERLKLAKEEAGRQAEKFGIEKRVLEVSAKDTEAQSQARQGLRDALLSGDAKKIEQAQRVATASGIKFDKPTLEFTTTVDQMGNAIVRTNKDTGEMDIVDRQSGAVRNIPAAGKPAAPAFQSEKEAERAAKAGQIKKGDRVIINGVSGTWQ